MAARIEGFTTTSQVVGGNRVMKVRQWYCYSEPSETYFEIRARLQTTKSQVQSIANGFSKTIEQVLAAPDFTDVAWSQDVTPAGQLLSVFTVYYYIPEKQASGFVEIPAGKFNLNYITEQALLDSGPGTFLFAP